MTPEWAQHREALLSDCAVSPDVFDHLVDRLYDFVVPYQHALETEAGKRNVYLYLQGLLSHLDRKNAEEIAALVDVERLVMQQFIGTSPHRCVVLDWGNPPGAAVDPRLDPAASALRAERAADGGVVHVQHRLYLSSSAAPINAQWVGPFVLLSYS